MKILFLCNYYHRAMIFKDSMNRLSNFGNEVKVFNAVVKNTKVDEKYKGIMDDQVIQKECFNKWDRFFYHLKQWKIYKALGAAYDVSKYDLIHSHTLFNGGLVVQRVKKHFGIPYVVSIRNTDMNYYLKIPMFKGIANRLVRDAAGVHFLSVPYKEKFINKYIKDELKENIRSKSVVISNGLEDFWLKHRADVKKMKDAKVIKILCVGKIDKNKNITTTIKAIKRLIKKGYDVTLTVIGKVIDRSVLKEIQEVDFVDVRSYLTKEALIGVYQAHDIYVMPSITESFGRVYAEAMTQGLPIIYTRGQGFDGIFEEGCVGYSVPSKDDAYIVECIEKIIADYSNLSSRCIAHSIAFDWQSISEKINKFYLEAVETGGSK